LTLKHRRKFTPEFKLQVLAEITAANSLAQAAREHLLHPTLIARWQKQHRQGVEANHKRVLRLMREDNLLCLRK